MKACIGIAPAALVAVACPVLHAQPANFKGLGPTSVANGLSADGSTIVGHAPVAAAAGRWTAATGWTVLPSPPGSPGTWAPSAVSADGAVVVGDDEALAVRWTQASGTVSLGTPGGYSDSIYVEGISNDGTVVVGTALKEQPGTCSATGLPWPAWESRGWRWKASNGTFDKLSPLGSQESSFATAVSGVGTVVFGRSASFCHGGPAPVGCLWDEAGHASAYHAGELFTRAASADGAVAVGYNPSGWAFRWTEPGGIVSLGVLPGMTVSDALAVSIDGAVVVGYSGVPNGGPWAALVWDEFHGARDLRGVLAAMGLNLTGWTLTSATGVSADGRTIAGNGINPTGQPEAWIAFLGDAVCYPDCNGDGALTVADFGCFQSKFVAGDQYADCNADGQLTVADFGCFQTRFVAACP